MADIQLDGLANQLRRRFKTEGAGLQRFESDMLSAINIAAQRITVDCDLEDRIPYVASLTGTVELDNAYFGILFDVTTLAMESMGQRPAAGEEAGFAAMQASIHLRIDTIRRDILNQAQAADTSDESDFAQLGGLG